jgi:redox-sensitive bicupin YhaK (pirin superfamily)
MTAGRGIVHAEMPAQNPDGSANIGMQLWVDLPAQLKDCEPRYRDLRASEIPVAKSEDGKVEVKVISGRAYGVDSLQELAYTPVWLLDVRVQPGGTFNTPLPHKWNAFIYTLSNSINLSSGSTSRTIPQYHNAVLEQEGDAIVASVPESADNESRFILVAGMPLNQPVSSLHFTLLRTFLTRRLDYPIRSIRSDQHRGYLQGNGRLPRLHQRLRAR